MHKKVYYLSTCDTGKKIFKQLDIGDEFEYQDIKTQQVTATQLEEMYQLSGSYEALFSKVARLYKEQKLAAQVLTEADFKRLILTHYTFLKRPVFIIGNKLFAGNAPKTVAAVFELLNKE